MVDALERVDPCCVGEKCQVCGAPAVSKIEEVIPNTNFHPATAYLCREHRDLVLLARHRAPAKQLGLITGAMAPDPAAELRVVQSALSFFASCIRSGEDWSETCEDVYGRSMRALERHVKAAETARAEVVKENTENFTHPDANVRKGAISLVEQIALEAAQQFMRKGRRDDLDYLFDVIKQAIARAAPAIPWDVDELDDLALEQMFEDYDAASSPADRERERRELAELFIEGSVRPRHGGRPMTLQEIADDEARTNG